MLLSHKKKSYNHSYHTQYGSPVPTPTPTLTLAPSSSSASLSSRVLPGRVEISTYRFPTLTASGFKFPVFSCANHFSIGAAVYEYGPE